MWASLTYPHTLKSFFFGPTYGGPSLTLISYVWIVCQNIAIVCCSCWFMNYQKQVSYECRVKSTALLDFSILNFKFMIHEIRGYLPNVQWPTAKIIFFQKHDSDNFWENIARIANVSLFHNLCHFRQGFNHSDLSTSSKVVCIHVVIKIHMTKKIYHFPCVEWSMLKLWITGLWSMKSIEHKFYAFGYWLHFTVQRDFSTEYLNGDQSMWIFLRCWMSVENAAENLQYQTL